MGKPDGKVRVVMTENGHLRGKLPVSSPGYEKNPDVILICSADRSIMSVLFNELKEIVALVAAEIDPPKSCECAIHKRR